MHHGYRDDEFAMVGRWDYAKKVAKASADVRSMGGKVPGRKKGESDKIYWQRITSVRDRLYAQGKRAKKVAAVKEAAKTAVKQAAAAGRPVPAQAVQAVAKTRAWLEGRQTDELLEELLERLDAAEVSVEPEAYIAPMRPMIRPLVRPWTGRPVSARLPVSPGYVAPWARAALWGRQGSRKTVQPYYGRGRSTSSWLDHYGSQFRR